MKVRFIKVMFIIIAGSLFLGCQSNESYRISNQLNKEVKVSSNKIGKQEYEIYVMILGKNAKGFVVENETSTEKLDENMTESLRKELKEMLDETFTNFTIKNKKPTFIEKKFPTSEYYSIISKNDVTKMFKDGLGWNEFYKKHPKTDGLYSLSQIGYDESGKQALVFMSRSCGWKCGSGDYYLLARENGSWKIKNTFNIWVS